MALSLNGRALALADALAADAEGFGVAVQRLANGTRLIDCGVAVAGGLEAGRFFAEIAMGGLGQVSFGHVVLDGWWLPALTVRSDLPVLACLAAQYAGWVVSHEQFFAMGSGPARALIRAEEQLYAELGYHDEARAAVLCLEGHTLPGPAVADYIAERAGIDPDQLTLLIAPTASTVGGVQVAARVLETALHKLHALGFDLHSLRWGLGTCPLPPTARSDGRAIGRTNDAILYGGQVQLTVQADDAAIEAVLPQIPSSASPDYGEPFYTIFKRYDNDFYKIDPLLFSPAAISISNQASGRSFQAGALNPEVLRRSFED